MFKRIGLGLGALCACLSLVSCGGEPKEQTIRVGTIAGPETQLMEVAKSVAKSCYNLDIKIVTFSDYNMPNTALNDGSIDANMFQHQSFLDAQIAARGYKLVAVAKTFIFPMGIYSQKYSQLDHLPLNARIGIPNDPSNEARALLLLQEAAMLTLAPGKTTNATLQDVVSNPSQIQLVPLSAAQLPRAMADLDAAVINTNYAIPAGLSLRDALYSEGAASPYANLLVVRADREHDPRLQLLVSALHSEGVLAAARRIFGDSAIAAWDKVQPLIPCQSS